jgi:hypothetical protein
MQFFNFDRSISTNDICSHGLSDFFHLTVRSSQSNDLKIKIQKIKSHELYIHKYVWISIQH